MTLALRVGTIPEKCPLVYLLNDLSLQNEATKGLSSLLTATSGCHSPKILLDVKEIMVDISVFEGNIEGLLEHKPL